MGSHFLLQHCGGLPAEPRCLGLAEGWVLSPRWVWEGMSKQAGNPLGPSMFRGGAGGRLRTEGRSRHTVFFLQVVTGSQGEGPAEEVTLLGWAEVLASGPGPRLFPGRCLCPCTDSSKFAFLLSELGRAGPLTPVGLRSPFSSVTYFRNV